MSAKKIHIIWKTGRVIDIILENNPVADHYYRCIKHLQHIDLPFSPRQNPLHVQQKNEVVTSLISASSMVGVKVDVDLLTSQDYLNKLHTDYFNNVYSSTHWYAFHDCIHILEDINNQKIRPTIWFDYGEKAGFLVKPFDRGYLKYATVDVGAGTCVLREHELGKTLFKYYIDNEPSDIDSICQVAKPWVYFKPTLQINYGNSVNYKTFCESNEDGFTKWFAPYKLAWSKYYNISDWTPRELFSVIPIGHIQQLDEFIKCFTNLDYPYRLAL